MGLLGKWVESLDYEYEILPSCTRFRSPRSTCEKCILACGENAISLNKGKPVIDIEKCVECGDCLSACPEQAIAGIFPKRTIIQNQLVITNDRFPTIKELLLFYKKGIKTINYDQSILIKELESSVTEVNSTLTQLGERPFTISFKKIEKSEEIYSRRELFSFWKKESTSIMRQVAPAKWRFNQDDLDLAKYYKDYQFTRIAIDIEKCTLCSVCQKLCKKNCFGISEKEFVISSQACSDCQLCVDICPEKAVKVEELISPIKNISYPIHKRTCNTCHKEFETLRESDEKCVMCTKRAGFLS